MKTLLTMCVVALTTLAAQAESFSLKHDKSGKVFGPFDTAEGSTVTIGGTSFTVVGTEAAPSPLLDALDEIMIPSAQFRYASPIDCIEHIQREVSLLKRTDGTINIVTRGVNVDPFAPNKKTVSLSLKSVSAKRVLDEICAQTNLQAREVDGVIVVSPNE